MLNYYDFLNIKEDSSESEIKLAYRKLAQKYHPDLYLGEDANEKMALLNEIKNTLLNSVKKIEYDKQLLSFKEFLNRRERADRERADRERADRERADRERADRERADRERADRERADRERADRERADRERADRERAKKKSYQSVFVLTSIFIVLGAILAIVIPYLEKSTPLPEANVDQSEELVPPLPAANVDQSEELAPPLPAANVDQSEEVIYFDLRIEKPLLQKALFDLKSIVNESGMAGAIANIEDCYENNPNKKYCFYLDYSARVFDAKIAQELNSTAPTVPFFDVNAFGERVYSNYYLYTEARNSMDMTNDSLSAVFEVINEQMPDVFMNN